MRTQKRQSQEQEKSIANDLKGNTVIASGALWGSKGDVRSDKYLVECKYTSKPYYTLSEKTWSKIAKEALHDNMRFPVMCVELNHMEKVSGDRYAVFDYNDFRLDKEIAHRFNSLDNYKSFIVNKVFRLQDRGVPYTKVCFSNAPVKGESLDGRTKNNLYLCVMPWDEFITLEKEVNI